VTARDDPSVLSTIQSRCAQAVSAVALSLLCGCAAVGDFGRVNSSLVRDDIHAWMGAAAVKGPKTAEGPLWKHPLTDEERRLRDLGYPLIEPPYDRNRWYSALGEYGLIGPWPFPERSAYATHLFQTAYRSQTARYNKLIEDIRNDVVRLDPFFATARYVTDIDLKREKSLAYVTKLTEEERSNTIDRILPVRAGADGDRGAGAQRRGGRASARPAGAADQGLQHLRGRGAAPGVSSRQTSIQELAASWI
jgi:hypothetical protein